MKPGASESSSSDQSPPQSNGVDKTEALARTQTKELWKFRLRPDDDEEAQDWWFASTAIPLLAATMGPLANVLSIAALITSWRNNYDPDYPGQDSYSTKHSIRDPRWCIALNAASLVCGFVGNVFLLFNFTRRVRYIIALPMTIILWYFATGILIGTIISMHKFRALVGPDQVWSQGFWHAIIAAVLYLLASMMLMVNMQGYFFGHYRQHFELTEEQRNLILQTMMFFIWLAGGGGVFAKVEGWAFVDALYFCDVTILTIGFGDIHPTNDISRGLVFPFTVGGIIILGLMVTSIHRFAKELGHENIIRHHVEKRRVNTLEHSVSISDVEAQRRPSIARFRQSISRPFNMHRERSTTIGFHPDVLQEFGPRPDPTFRKAPMAATRHRIRRVRSRKPKLVLLYEEKDRFTAMREIQRGTAHFKKWYALTMSILAFGLLWCVGAVGFWRAEAHTQNFSYFQALYFCYVSLTTVGYGDLSPTSNAGKPFFIVWSLIAVPTMTILISDMGDTVIASFKRGTFTLADWTVLPKFGLYRAFIERHPALLHWLQEHADHKAAKARLEQGFRTGPSVDAADIEAAEGLPPQPATLEALATAQEDEHLLARRLALAIRRTAGDLKQQPQKRYSYEEWVEFTRLIRFSKCSPEEMQVEEEDEGLVEWDWIGEKSPMMAEQSESEWVLDRLCESLGRYMRRQGRGAGGGGVDGGVDGGSGGSGDGGADGEGEVDAVYPGVGNGTMEEESEVVKKEV